MTPSALNPILNVSDLQASFDWFERFGWTRAFEWGEPASFGIVHAGENLAIMLCVDGQGGRGKGANSATFGPGGDETADRGVWMSLWVDDVDAVHAGAIKHALEVVFEPTDMPWGVRECHIRHPDGHVFRVTQSASA